MQGHAEDRVGRVQLDCDLQLILTFPQVGKNVQPLAQIEDLIQQEVDAIIIWPTNGEAVIPAVRKAHSAGIPVIVTNSNIAEAGFDFVASFSGPDNIAQGSRSAEIMCDKFKEMGIEGEAQVVHITGQPGYTTAIERAKGFEDRLPEVCPDVTVIDTQPGDWNREKSQQVMEAFLVKYDDIDGVYAGDDNMGVGALNAAKAAGRDGIIFVGATNFSVGYEAMEAGEYWGWIYQSPVDDAEVAEANRPRAAQKEAQVTHAHVDVTERSAVQAMVAHTVETFGKLDVKFNNAGVNRPMNFLDVPKTTGLSS